MPDELPQRLLGKSLDLHMRRLHNRVHSLLRNRSVCLHLVRQRSLQAYRSNCLRSYLSRRSVHQCLCGQRVPALQQRLRHLFGGRRELYLLNVSAEPVLPLQPVSQLLPRWLLRRHGSPPVQGLRHRVSQVLRRGSCGLHQVLRFSLPADRTHDLRCDLQPRRVRQLRQQRVH